MPKVAKFDVVTDEEAVALLRAHLKTLPPPKDTGFKVNDAVRLDTGDIGVVESIEEGVNVIYYGDDGLIHGPAFGYDLEKLDL